MTTIKEKLQKVGLDFKKLDGFVEEKIFVGKESSVFVVKSDKKTKVIKNG